MSGGRTLRPALFDVDGTLVDSMDAVAETFDRIMREEAGIVHPREYYRRFVGPPLSESFAELGVDPGYFVGAYRRRYSAKELELSLFDGIEAMLERLHEAGVPMAIATSKRTEAAVALLERLGVTLRRGLRGRRIPRPHGQALDRRRCSGGPRGGRRQCVERRHGGG